MLGGFDFDDGFWLWSFGWMMVATDCQGGLDPGALNGKLSSGCLGGCCQTENEEVNLMELERLRRRSRYLADIWRFLMIFMVIADGEIDRYKHIRDMGREMIERMLREIRAPAECCPMNDQEIYYGTVWHRLRDYEKSTLCP